MSTMKRALTVGALSVLAVVLPAAAQAAAHVSKPGGIISYIWSWGG
ncbi:MAG: hypothetical protein KBB39_04435 [Phycicoccus sp.]|nr:hypothetical protein [Phycicoccus sp.]